MSSRTRREFLAQVGRGSLIAAIGLGTAVDLGLASARAAEEEDRRLRFGKLESLVEMLQTSDGDAMLPRAIDKLKSGTSLQELVGAAALANARTFGGQDYIGMHTMMALAPCYQMSKRLAAEQAALPVLKVLHRNSRRISEVGGVDAEVLQAVAADPNIASTPDGRALLAAVNAKDFDRAEKLFAAIVEAGVEPALEELLIAVHDQQEVHRIVMPYRAYDLLGILGVEHAHTMLRQSVRYCVQQDKHRHEAAGGRDVLPKLLDEYDLLDENQPASRKADDAWLSGFAETLFKSTPAQAAESAAAALREGFSPTDIGMGLSLTANQLVLRDAGRPANQARPEKPAGSVHGDSIGVHASDSANAWRHLARVGSRRNQAACCILGAHQVASDRVNRGGNFLDWQPYPTEEHLAALAKKEPKDLLALAESGIRENDQALTAAAVHQFCAMGGDPNAAFGLLLKYAITEDGALHAEKYFQTVAEDFADSPSALKSRHLIGLARVTASEHGHPAPGIETAKKLLGV